jgi:hypothetical protein
MVEEIILKRIQRCENCKHWNDYESTIFGSCRVAGHKDYWVQSENFERTLKDNNEEPEVKMYGDLICSHKDFSCLLFKHK